jgi:hypothetical protein
MTDQELIDSLRKRVAELEEEVSVLREALLAAVTYKGPIGQA